MRWIAVAACLVGLLSGCQGVPRVPGQARDVGYGQGEEDRRVVDPAVRPASAHEPLSSAAEAELPGVALSPTGKDFEEEEDDDGFDWSDLDPKNVYAKAKDLVGLGPDENIARGLYKEGEDLFREQRYLEAAAKFKSAAGRWPDSILEEDALFWAGESYFFADRYAKANDAYGRLLKKHEYSRHLDRVTGRLFEIGRYWEQMYKVDPHWPTTPNMTDSSRPLFDTWGHAIKSYDLVRTYDPTGPLADDSVMAAANAYFLKERYEDAAYHYDLIRKEYPRSEHQIAAHLLGMKSQMSVYQGPLYDRTPLDEAGEIADQAIRQFSSELGDNRELVLQTKNRVVEEKAASDWAVAQYYDKKKCYGAARIYYNAILKDYPHTGVAQQARARLDEIEDFPDDPPDYFKWLNDLIPSEKD